jgi:hypothetical protein
MDTRIQEVADNVYEFQVPIPFKFRDINLYLVKDPEGCLHHDRRLATMFDTLNDGPQTAYTVARHTFPTRHDPFDHWLMLGETLAHLELLEARHQVTRRRDNGHVLFERVITVE